LTKSDLVEELSNQTELTRRVSREAVDAVILVITNSLGGKEKVTLVGFGTFQVRGRKARRASNPQTGKTIEIPAKKVPEFLPGKGLREKIA
jgi:DNA-binding protein HU-beta